MNLDNTYLHTLNKDELIQLVITVNNLYLKSYKEILKEKLKHNKYLYDTSLGSSEKWIEVCHEKDCEGLVSMAGGCFNFGIECEVCGIVYCEECERRLNSQDEKFKVCQKCTGVYCIEYCNYDSNKEEKSTCKQCGWLIEK